MSKENAGGATFYSAISGDQWTSADADGALRELQPAVMGKPPVRTQRSVRSGVRGVSRKVRSTKPLNDLFRPF